METLCFHRINSMAGNTSGVRQCLGIFLSLGLLLLGCGGQDSNSGGSASHSSNPPVIQAISPNVVSVGERIKIIGTNFVDLSEGTPLLEIEGRFFDKEGNENSFNQTVKPEIYGATELDWQLWPNVVFHPEGDQLGYFVGTVRVVNQYTDGSNRASKPFNVKLDVGPSLVLRALRPADGVCGDVDVVDATIAGVPLTVAVKAIGMNPGTAESPLVFNWSFSLAQLDVKVGSFGSFDLETAAREDGYVTITDNVTSGVFSGMQDESGCDTGIGVGSGIGALDSYLTSFCTENANGEKSYLFQVLGDMSGSGGLKVLKTRDMAINADYSGDALISVSARDGSGNYAALNIPLGVYSEATFKRDTTKDIIIEREAPEMVDDSIQASTLEANVTFQESTSISRSSSYGQRIDGSATLQFGLNFVQMTTWNLAFSVDERLDVSESKESSKSVSQMVPPGMCAAYYRQTEKIRQYATVTGHTVCGETVDAGEIWREAYQWTREVAIDTQCPPPYLDLKPAGACYEDCEVVQVSGVSEGTEH